MGGAGGAAGVLLGGILTDVLGWQWILLINVPIGLAIAWARLRASSAERARPRRARALRPRRRAVASPPA